MNVLRSWFGAGYRKTTYGAIALAALLVGAFQLDASFGEYRDGVLVWLVSMLGGHVADGYFARPLAVPKVGAAASTPAVDP